MIKRIILAFPLLSHLPRYSQPFSFSNQQPTPEDEGQLEPSNDRAANFYRNSIRRININDKGRGKFTEHHLLRLVKLTENPSQTALLFEAYYNYLGHFTVISNSTVDKMLLKVLTFPTFPLDSVLELYQNHNYLAYYPGYAVTRQLLTVAQDDEEGLGKVLLMLSRSPLVKLDRGIVEQLMEMLQKEALPQKIFSTTIKLIVQKQVLNILPTQPTDLQLLKFFADSILQRYNKVAVFSVKPSEFLLTFFQQIKQNEQLTEETHFQLALLSLTFGAKEHLYEHMVAIKDNQKQQQLFGYLKQVNPLFITQAVEYFQSLQLSEDLRAQLQGLRQQ